MGCLPYFKFYAGDWTIGTLSLSLAERGAYITLLAWSWENGPLPASEGARARVLGLRPDEFAEVWEALAPFWRKTARGYVNKRLEDERKTAIKTHEKRVEAGRLGGLSKGAK